MSQFERREYLPEYASGFDIRGDYFLESKLIKVTNPWQGADSVVTSLLILRGGERCPAGFDGQVLDGEARRIVAMSSTQIAMLDRLGETGRIVGVSGIDYISNPLIQARRDSIGDVGYEGNIDYELLLSLEPDLVLLYGVNGASPMEAKLREYGIPYLYVGDYLEESPLGKAEWLVALAEVVGRRSDGESLFDDIPLRYYRLRQLVADSAIVRPKVMFNVPYGDSWFLPSTTGYLAQLVEDAGGEYVYKGETGNSSVVVSTEEAYKLTSEADVWLHVGMASSLDELSRLCPKMTDTRCFTSGQVYNNTLRTNDAGGNDYYESAVVNPDLLLRDMIRIFHPGSVDDEFVYYKQLD
ncbi:MAG: ABC transporter substrate-binding protein [Clostridium sp.]|nr:ABC transporter substrate-binding protein [Clostridium sp.]